MASIPYLRWAGQTRRTACSPLEGTGTASALPERLASTSHGQS